MSIQTALLTAVTLLFSFHVSFAQTRKFPGYYISKDGDTTTGFFPTYRQWNKNPTAVKFQAHEASTPIELNSENCATFHIEGEEDYVSYTGPRMVNPTTNEEATRAQVFEIKDDQFENVSTFLRLVIRTKDIDIFVLNDNRRINLFINKLTSR